MVQSQSKTVIQASEQATALIHSAFVWDNHVCLPLRRDDREFLPQLVELKNAGYNAVTINISYDLIPWHDAIQIVANMRHWLRSNADDYLLIEQPEHFQEAMEKRKLGVLFDIEGGLALDGHLPMIQLYYDLGVRWMLLAYNQSNSLAGGCQESTVGLSDLGRAVVSEMERVGMIVCCSHTSERAAVDIMEMSSNPVIFSHSNAKAVHDHNRNISDQCIDLCAKTNGVIGVTGVSLFLNDENSATSNSIADHIDYIVQRVGPEHVGISSDYTFDTEEMMEWVNNHPEVFDPKQFSKGVDIMVPHQIVEVADCLLKRNYSEFDVKKILGGNFLRVATEVWC